MNFGMKHMIMNTAMGGEAGGGAGAGTGAADPGAGTGGAADPNAGYQAPEWAKGVDADLMNDPIMKNHKDVSSVIKSYVHAARMVGADKIVVPGKNASPEEIKAYIGKLGLPESVDKYELTLAKDSIFGGEKAQKIKELALQHNILPGQLAEMLKFVEADLTSLVEADSKQSTEKVEAGLKSLKQEWGEEGFKKNVAVASAAVKHFGGDEFVKYLNETGLGNDATLIKIFANIGSKLKSEDSFNNEVTSRFGMTKDEAQKNINNLYTDKAFLDATHPAHKDRVQDMLKYQSVLIEN